MNNANLSHLLGFNEAFLRVEVVFHGQKSLLFPLLAAHGNHFGAAAIKGKVSSVYTIDRNPSSYKSTSVDPSP